MSLGSRRRRAMDLIVGEGMDALLVSTQPDLRYLTGFTGSTGTLALTRNGCCLFTDGRYAEQARAETGRLRVHIEQRSAALVAAGWLRERGVRRCGFDATQTTVAAIENLKKSLPSRDRRSFFWPVQGVIARLRETKEKNEVELIRAAAAIGDRLFDAVLRVLEPGRTEVEIADVLLAEARRRGAEGVSFDTIVASGERSAMPHGRASSAKLPRRGFVTLDFGVSYQGYCSDMTRTVHMGRPEPQERDVYHSVLEAQMAAITLSRPGIPAGDVDKAARAVLTRAGLAEYFTHSIGHGLGMEVHESPRIAMNQTQALERGMVITIEPGIYLPRRFGVRIEDMLLLTARGGEVLTQSSKALIEL